MFRDGICQVTSTYYTKMVEFFDINYDLLAPSVINFMIPEHFIEAWEADYTKMRNYFIYGPSLEFNDLMRRIKDLQVSINTSFRLLPL